MANELPAYPKDHQVGVRVPKGGSDCAKCEYLDRDTMKDCKEEHFIEWNGRSRIPGQIDEYCCDFFEAKKAERKDYFFGGDK